MFEDLIKHICPICKLSDNNIKKESAGNSSFIIDCPRCKKFIIPLHALVATQGNQPPMPKLSAWIRDFNEKSSGQWEFPEITEDSLKEIPAGLPDRSPREKQIILLQNIERKTEYPGKPVEIISDYDIPLAWASSKEEFMYYIDSLINRGLLRNIGRTEPVHRNMVGSLIYGAKFSVEITANGWDYLEQLERRIEERTQAFVAMSFSDDLKAVWEGPIFDAINRAGYKPFRVDAEPHSDRIDVKIISEIKNSRFVIADVTQQKRGVYFEAGFALGLGLPVLWCVRKDDLENVHFDTRQYNHIVWETPEELGNKLYDFICAIIGKRKEI